MSSRELHIEGVGPVLLEKSRRARRVNISVRPDIGVRVAVPVRESYSFAQQFLEANLGWVRGQLEKIHKARTENINYGLEIDRKKARKYLVARLDYLAAKHGFRYNRVFVRNQRTLWGSCSEVNNINLNVNLVRLPEALCDYVILHELTHTRIKNHSRKFWAELGRHVENPRGFEKQLRQYWCSIG